MTPKHHGFSYADNTLPRDAVIDNKMESDLRQYVRLENKRQDLKATSHHQSPNHIMDHNQLVLLTSLENINY